MSDSGRIHLLRSRLLYDCWCSVSIPAQRPTSSCSSCCQVIEQGCRWKGIVHVHMVALMKYSCLLKCIPRYSHTRLSQTLLLVRRTYDIAKQSMRKRHMYRSLGPAGSQVDRFGKFSNSQFFFRLKTPDDSSIANNNRQYHTEFFYVESHGFSQIFADFSCFCIWNLCLNLLFLHLKTLLSMFLYFFLHSSNVCTRDSQLK